MTGGRSRTIGRAMMTSLDQMIRQWMAMEDWIRLGLGGRPEYCFSNKLVSNRSSTNLAGQDSTERLEDEMKND
jgi:hypothetical protein